MLKIYCDGACSGNPGPGGWAFVIPELNVEQSGYEPDTTNNRMEITAVLEALKYVYNNYHEYLDHNVEIITDSQYVINTMVKGWQKNKNTDLWGYLEYYLWYFLGSFKWTWVKGHASNEYNNRCDELAVAEYKTKTAKVIKMGVDSKFEELEITNEEVENYNFQLNFSLVKKFRVNNFIYRMYECPSFLRDFFVLENNNQNVVVVGDYNECMKHLTDLKNNIMEISL